jgi:hypothetical protein
VCSYCGSRFAAAAFEEPPAPAAAPAPAPGQRRSLPRLASLLFSLGGLLPLVIGGAVLYHTMAPVMPGMKGSLTGVRLGSPTRALWDAVGGPPVPVSIGGEEAVVGRMRLAGDQLYIVASQSATARPLWKLGPLGTYSEGYRDTHFTIAAERVVVSDASGALRVYDLQSGRQRKTIPLRDRASNLCATSQTTVAVAVLDRHHVALDLDTLSLREAPLPDGCAATARSFRARAGRDDSPRVRRPALRGFDVREAYAEGDLAVAAAVKSPGTPVPYAMGFLPTTREVRWQQLLPTVEPLSVQATEYAALVGGRYVAVYGVGSARWHLTALDAREGARLWDVELQPLFAVDQIEGLVVTAQYVYLTRTQGLEIYDAGRGQLRGTVGNVTYR